MKFSHIAAGALIIFLSGALPGVADTNLFNDGTWVVDGGTDPGQNPSSINIITNKLPAGAFSELKFYYNLDGTNFAQVFSIKGKGILQPSLPPPGEVGGAYSIGSYWDCEQGFIGPMAVTEIELRKPKGKGELQLRGKMSNNNSMQATDLSLLFLPVQSNSVQVEVSYKLTATRDFCVDITRHATQEEFHAVTVLANYVSPETNDNDLVRYKKVVSEFCTGYYGCSVNKDSFCAVLTNKTGYIINSPRRLGESTMSLFHTQTTPRNTPSLHVSFRSPARGRIKPQGYLTQTSDPTEQNVQFWGNWVDAQRQYKERQKVYKFRYTLEAETPKLPNCDRMQE